MGSDSRGFVRVEISLWRPKWVKGRSGPEKRVVWDKIALYLRSPNENSFRNQGAHSSAGSEHLPYKQRVRGSNPCAPTPMKATPTVAFFRRFEEWGILA